jgi:ubiquinone/menaquinone biosynthesis C-methylase UbiE
METREMSDIESRMKGFYNQSEVYHDLLANHEAFRRDSALQRYVSLVSEYGLGRGIHLDLGCGTGETTRRLAAAGRNAVGLDISTLFLKAQGPGHALQDPRFVVGDVVRLPFRSHSVSCVCLHDMIEHVPNTDQLLREIIRVLRADGRIIIVSPNLLSPIRPIRHIVGSEGFNTGFYGSYLKAFQAIFSNFYLLASKLLAGQAEFSYRTPLLGDEFQCPDDDAVYLANMVDLKKWFHNRGFAATYLQFLPGQNGISGCLKSKILDWFPWLDKGFCLVVQRMG